MLGHPTEHAEQLPWLPGHKAEPVHPRMRHPFCGVKGFTQEPSKVGRFIAMAVPRSARLVPAGTSDPECWAGGKGLCASRITHPTTKKGECARVRQIQHNTSVAVADSCTSYERRAPDVGNEGCAEHGQGCQQGLHHEHHVWLVKRSSRSVVKLVRPRPKIKCEAN